MFICNDSCFGSWKFPLLSNQEKLLAATKKYLLNANNQFQKEKYNESAKSFLDAINTSPNKNITNRAKLGLSNVYKSQKKYNEALEILNSAWSDIKNYKEEKNSIEYELIFRSLISIHMKNKNCAEISKLITREFKITKKDIQLAENTLNEKGKFEIWHTVKAINKKSIVCAKAQIHVYLRDDKINKKLGF